MMRHIARPAALPLMVLLCLSAGCQTRKGAAPAPAVPLLRPGPFDLGIALDQLPPDLSVDSYETLSRLCSEDPQVRAGGARGGFSEQDAPVVLPYLVALLSDRNPVKGMTNYFSRLACPGMVAAEALGEMDPGRIPVVPALLASLKSPDPWVRTLSAFSLGTLKDPPVVRSAISPLDLRPARYALGAYQPELAPAVAPLILALRDREVLVRAEAAWALSMLRDPRAHRALLGLLSDNSPQVRTQAIGALGALAENDLSVRNRERLGDRRPSRSELDALRRSNLGGPLAPDRGPVAHGKPTGPVALDWGEVTPEDLKAMRAALAGVAPRLVATLSDPDPGVRAAGAYALGKLVGGGGAAQQEPARGTGQAPPPTFVPDPTEVVSALRRALADSEGLVRYQAARALYSILGTDGAKAFVSPELLNIPPHVSIFGGHEVPEPLRERQTEEALPLMRSPDAKLRQIATQALSGEVSPLAIEALTAALNDRDAGVRSAAATVLAGMRDSKADAALKNALRDGLASLPAVEGLTRMPTPGWDVALLEVLRTDRRVYVRQAAARQLANSNYNDGPTQQALLEIATREKPLVALACLSWALRAHDNRAIPVLLAMIAAGSTAADDRSRARSMLENLDTDAARAALAKLSPE